MEIPKTLKEAEELKLEPIDVSEVDFDAAGGAHHDGGEVGILCYTGPCVNGRRVVCYSSPSGCNRCYTTSIGC